MSIMLVEISKPGFEPFFEWGDIPQLGFEIFKSIAWSPKPSFE